METKKNRTKVVVSILALVALVLFSLSGYAGKLEPNSPPGPTMKTLQEIYDAVVSQGSGISQREGFCKRYEIGPSSSEEITVPTGKRFVLLKLFVWNLTRNFVVYVDDEILFNGDIVYTDHDLVPDSAVWDFPDRCVVAGAGETLKLFNGHGTENGIFTLIGYFYNVP